MNCFDIQKHLMEYADGESTAEFQKIISEHLISCRSCRRYEENLRLKVMDPLRAALRHKPSEEIWMRIQTQIENSPPPPFAVLKEWTFLHLFHFKQVTFAVVTLLVLTGGLFLRYSFVPPKTAVTNDLGSYVFLQVEILDQFSSSSGVENLFDFGTSIEDVLIKAEVKECVIANEYMIPDVNFGTSVEHYFM